MTDIFRKALAQHQKGQLAEAERLYRSVLKRDPNNAECLHLLGVIHFQRGRFDEAVKLIQRAVSVAPSFAAAHYNLGRSYEEQVALSEAAQSYGKAIALQPSSADAYLGLGNVNLAQGDYDGALKAYERALALKPRNPLALSNKGKALKELGRLDEALAAFDQALAARPGFFEALNNRGNLLKSQGKLVEALASFRAAIAAQPNSAVVNKNLGTVLHDLRRYEEALAAYDQALGLAPDLAEAHLNRGKTLSEMDRLEEASASFERASTLVPHLADAWREWGRTLRLMDRPSEALPLIDKALALRPDYFEGLVDRGNALRDLNRHAEALQAYDRALALKPGHPVVRYNKALIELEIGRFAEGWDDFECRLSPEADRGLHIILQGGAPVWNGEPLAGPLMVRGEQGIGDEIIFASMLGELAPRGIQTKVTVQPKLIPIFKRSFPEMEILPRGDETVPRDYAAEIAIGSLGRIFRRSSADFERTPSSYLRDDAVRTQALRNQEPFSSGPVIGISWRTSSRHGGKVRTAAIENFAALLGLPGYRFVNLQYGEVADDIARARETLGADISVLPGIDVFDDVDGLLSIIMACDAVVTIDNATVHLAAAAGKSTMLLLAARESTCYWQDSNDRSIWYPSVRIFRQRTQGDWSEPVSRVAELLRR